MKKILFATLMFLGVAVVSNAQAPAKNTTHKKEATKPASSVSSVSPTTNTKTSAKPATAASSTKTATTDAGKKHKKHHSASKKEPKK